VFLRDLGGSMTNQELIELILKMDKIKYELKDLELRLK